MVIRTISDRGKGDKEPSPSFLSLKETHAARSYI
jgi:hypothetical protein